MRDYNRLDAYLIIAGGLSPHDLEAQETLDQMVHSIRIHEARTRELSGFVEAVQRHVEGLASFEEKVDLISAELHGLGARIRLRTAELPMTTILRTGPSTAEKDGDR